MDLSLLVVDVALHLSNVNLSVHLDPLLLVDVPLPHLSDQFQVSYGLLVLNGPRVAINQLAEVLDHLSEDVDLGLDDIFVALDELPMLLLQDSQVSLVHGQLHLGLDVLFLLGDGHDVRVLLLDLLEVLLDLLRHRLLRSVLQLLSQVLALDRELVLPSQLHIVDEANHLSGSRLSLLQLSHELVVDSCCDESDGQLSLGLELVDSLLKGLVDVLHLKVLLLHSSKIGPQAANAFIVRGDEALVVVKLGTVLLNDLIEAILHHVDLQSQLVHLLV